MHFTSGSASLGHYECNVCDWERPNGSCSQNRSAMKESNKSGVLQPFSSKQFPVLPWNALLSFSSPSFFSFFLPAPVCSDLPWASFDTPWQWLWSINHLFPELSVPACSEMKQQPLDHRHGRFQPFLLCFSAKPPHAQQSNIAMVLHTHLKPSGLFSGKVQIKHY